MKGSSLVDGVGRLNIVTMAIFPKLNYSSLSKSQLASLQKLTI